MDWLECGIAHVPKRLSPVILPGSPAGLIKAKPTPARIDAAQRPFRSRCAKFYHVVQPLENERSCIDDAAVRDAVLHNEHPRRASRTIASEVVVWPLCSSTVVDPSGDDELRNGDRRRTKIQTLQPV